MHIWFCAAIPADSAGGVNRNISGFARVLREHGHAVRIIYGGENGCSMNYLAFMVYLGFLLIRSYRKPPHWIIARSTDGCICALLSALVFRTTFVALHNHGWEEYIHRVEQRLRTDRYPRHTTWKARLIRFPLLRLTLRHCRICICGTVHDMRHLRKAYPAHARRLRLACNGVDVPPDMPPPGDEERRRHLLAVGPLTWRKRIDYAISLFSVLVRDGYQGVLHLVGAGQSALPGALAPSEIREKIEVIPHVGMDDMKTWYARCDGLLSASRYEGGHSLVILEAMAHGCLVFAAPIPATLEFISNGLNGILIRGSHSQEDARTIAGIMNDRARAHAIRTRALRTAQRNRWDRQGNRLERILAGAS